MSPGWSNWTRTRVGEDPSTSCEYVFPARSYVKVWKTASWLSTTISVRRPAFTFASAGENWALDATRWTVSCGATSYDAADPPDVVAWRAASALVAPAATAMAAMAMTSTPAGERQPARIGAIS